MPIDGNKMPKVEFYTTISFEFKKIPRKKFEQPDILKITNLMTKESMIIDNEIAINDLRLFLNKYY